MNGERLSGRKDVRQECKVLIRLGFEWDGRDSYGHPVFTHPAHGTVTLPETPSSPRWREHKRREVAKLMGIPRPELEALIAGQASVGKRARHNGRGARGRTASPPRALRHLNAVIEAPPAETPAVEVVPVVAFAASDPITDRRRDQWARAAEELARANSECRWPWRDAA